VTGGSQSRTARDMQLEKAASRVMVDEIIWDEVPSDDTPAATADSEVPEPRPKGNPDATPLKAAE
jgi:hypothetical protein